ncbi:hypothetical protein [Solidesulfovibrio alcoholivorans]|uniref:hypothetical protein n=1 Tax=Solidesulfovibrio alcoholivorans TaxID=81406 RepID=UPI0004970A6E|nr:hypothetical protein [Solidesulfovibrio alcoholivorans]
MNLTLTITGLCCDLALHPVDNDNAARVCMLGENLYKTNSLEWWRANGNNTCGMRLTRDSRIEASIDGAPVLLDPAHISTAATMLTQRELLDRPEAQVCLLGYDDEQCSRTWTWRNVSACDVERFQFLVQCWDRILGEKEYLVLEDVLYAGRAADSAAWGESQGFSFREPMVVPMDVVRNELGARQEKAA